MPFFSLMKGHIVGSTFPNEELARVRASVEAKKVFISTYVDSTSSASPAVYVYRHGISDFLADICRRAPHPD